MNELYDTVEDILIDHEAEEVEDAIEDVIDHNYNDIDNIADITDEDVDEFEDDEDEYIEYEVPSSEDDIYDIEALSNE